MFVYTQAARECCSEPRSLHRILLAKLMMCCAGWGRRGGGGGWGGHSPFSGPRTQVLPVCLLEKYECARDGPNQP